MTHRTNQTHTMRALLMSWAALAGATNAGAVSMKTSDDGGGTANGGNPTCVIKGASMPPIEVPGPSSSTALRSAAKPVQSPKTPSQQAAAALPNPALKIAYTATWQLKGGNPLDVQFCVKPTLQNIGNVPWTTPFMLHLSDARYSDDRSNEDPYAQNPGTTIPPNDFSQAIGHVPQTFTAVPVSGSIPVGSTVAIQAPGWCGKVVKWYQRPRLVIGSQGAGVDNSCPVVFGAPANGPAEVPKGGPSAKQ